MKELIEEYTQTLKRIRKLKEKAGEEDRKIIASMESDLHYAIQWMKTGRNPNARRGAERLAAYQKEKPIDPIHIQRYVTKSVFEQPEGEVSRHDLERIEDALSCLTEIEKEVYLMARGHCIPRSEIALMIGVERGTVNKILTRADEKVKERTKYSIFCLPSAT